MSKDIQLLAWAGAHVEKAQKQKAYCKITVHIIDGEIIRIERNDTFKPPEAGMQTQVSGC